MSTLTVAFNIKPAKAELTGTVYIRADGSIDPPTAPITTTDGVTYFLTEDIMSYGDGIIVERDNIILDGNGHTIQGRYAYPSKGIDLSQRSNITIRNINIKNFYYGIRLYSSSNNVVSGNNITNNKGQGLALYNQSDNNTVCRNNISNNDRCGIWSFKSIGNIIYENNIISNKHHGIDVDPRSVNGNHDIFRNVIANNIGNGITFANGGGANVYGNTIAENDNGTFLVHYCGAWFYNNNFINNRKKQAVIGPGVFNVDWNSSYPSGGNYWSDKRGVNGYCGAFQNLTGSDGICDSPYAIDDGGDVDWYPLMGNETANLTIETYTVNGEKVTNVRVWIDWDHGNNKTYYSTVNVRVGKGVHTLNVSRGFILRGAWYFFKQWSDGSTQNPRDIIIVQNMTLIAYYASGGGDKYLPWSTEPDQPTDESEVNP